MAANFQSKVVTYEKPPPIDVLNELEVVPVAAVT